MFFNNRNYNLNFCTHGSFPLFILIQKVEPKNQDAAKGCAEHRACWHFIAAVSQLLDTAVSEFYIIIPPLNFLWGFATWCLHRGEAFSYFLFPLFVLIQKVEPKNQDTAKACAKHRTCWHCVLCCRVFINDILMLQTRQRNFMSSSPHATAASAP